MNTKLLAYRRLLRFFLNGDKASRIAEYNDLFCLFLSQTAYFTSGFIRRTMKRLGCESIKAIDYLGPQAFCVRFHGINYIVVKGLSGRNKMEWGIVANFITKVFMGARVHGGFAIVAHRLLKHVKDYLTLNPGKTILTGHSMGGAVATLLSLAVDGSRVVTFGAPRMIDMRDRMVFSEEEIVHYQITGDPVTHLPPFRFSRPGSEVVETRQFNPLRIFENHKLYVYGLYIIPESYPNLLEPLPI